MTKPVVAPPCPLSPTSETKLQRACAVALVLMLAEFLGGYLAGSLSIMSDAAHMLTDVLSFAVSLVAVRLTKRPPTDTMPFGYHRAEVLGAIASILVLWLITALLVHDSICRILVEAAVTHRRPAVDRSHGPPVDGRTMFTVAAVALVVNVVLMRILGDDGHGHSHGHSLDHSRATDHGPRSSTTIPRRNLNVDAAYIHVLGDLLQNIGVLVAGAVIWYRPSWHIIDPILTLVFGLIVAWTTIGLCKTSLAILMEASPSHVNLTDIHTRLLALPAVHHIHALRVWAISSDRVALSVHLVVSADDVMTTTATTATAALRDLDATLTYITIQVEVAELGYGEGEPAVVSVV
ncbi:Aste57867_24374 [Aphanomyces stellatus]|uniref:Aste57867_24374 protein n=1 Tax=Aphanomyces stellatus TaxID=120398 RepID=A0A485LQ62_9STRA|nr:hypothetical protein As57867_024298 [Aphanomyces stellatus]VFU01014.1 Aste57867_24374 [Aphanomyces stellatus]